jgi:hypothetical protein
VVKLLLSVVVNTAGPATRSQHAGNGHSQEQRDAPILAAFAAAVRELREERDLSQERPRCALQSAGVPSPHGYGR